MLSWETFVAAYPDKPIEIPEVVFRPPPGREWLAPDNPDLPPTWDFSLCPYPVDADDGRATVGDVVKVTGAPRGQPGGRTASTSTRR